MEADYYKVLGVDPAASSKEIGKAFRQLARKVHPDKLPQGSSEEVQLQAKHRFQQVAKAWEILGDPQQRSLYDAQRSTAPAEESQGPGRASRRAKAERDAEDPEGEERRFREEMRRAKREEQKKQKEAEEARKEKERDKTGGLGGHWVKASNFSGAPDGPTRSGGIHSWSGWSAARGEDVHSDASSELSFDLHFDLNKLDLRFAEKISGEDDWDEVWEMHKKGSTPEANSPISPLRTSADGVGAEARPRCRCTVQ